MGEFMNNLLTFSYTIQSVRIHIDEHGEPWFCLKDVCDSLNLTNSRMVTNRLSQKGVSSIDGPSNGGIQSHTFIDEPNLYRVIFRSDKPEAIKFQDWVFEQVLPSIRKTGQYRVPTRRKAYAQQQILEQIEMGNNTLNQIAVALDKSWATVQRTINRMEHNGQIEAIRIGRIKILSKNKRLN
jgi:prophage antirepressor-like protein